MNAAPRPHHRNISCIIYSAGPLVQGERTHINFQPRSSPPHSCSCLLLKAEALARSLSFFLSFFPSLFFLPRWGAGSILRGPEASTPVRPASCGHAALALLFIFLLALSLVFPVRSNLIWPKDDKQEVTGGFVGCPLRSYGRASAQERRRRLLKDVDVLMYYFSNGGRSTTPSIWSAGIMLHDGHTDGWRETFVL